MVPWVHVPLLFSCCVMTQSIDYMAFQNITREMPTTDSIQTIKHDSSEDFRHNLHHKLVRILIRLCVPLCVAGWSRFMFILFDG